MHFRPPLLITVTPSARLTEKHMHRRMHINVAMARNIAIANDVYKMLSEEKRKGESFSDVIRRLSKRKRSLLEFAGAWADIPQAEYAKMEAAWRWANQPLEEALGHRRERNAMP